MPSKPTPDTPTAHQERPPRTERPFLPEYDFTEVCEGCGALPGQYCREDCDCGYTADDARADAIRAERQRADSPEHD